MSRTFVEVDGLRELRQILGNHLDGREPVAQKAGAHELLELSPEGFLGQASDSTVW